MTLTLYRADGACSLAAHLVLEELGVAYATVVVDLASGGNWQPAYLEVNPRGKVPALVDDGRLLTENVAIIHHLARAHGDGSLRPRDEWEWAKSLEMAAWFSNTIHPHFTHFRRPGRFTTQPSVEPAISAAGRDRFRAALGEIDDLLAARSWILGDHFGVCDAYAMVFVDWARRIALDTQQLKFVAHWLDAMLARPAVRKVLARERSPIVPTEMI